MIRLTLVLTLITLIAATALGFVYMNTAPMIEKQRIITDELGRRTALPDPPCAVFVRIESDGFVYYEGYSDPDTTELVGYTVKARGKGYSSNIETIVGVDVTGRIAGMKITSQQETPGLGSRIEEVKTTKTVLDALKELWGRAKRESVQVEIIDQDGLMRCLNIEVRDRSVCKRMEEMIAAPDTGAVCELAPRLFGLSPEDSLAVFCDLGLTIDVTKKLLEKLRSQQTPWFQEQFRGKTYRDLILTKEATEKNIQAITGATISSTAVTESVKEAIRRLEMAIGGFKEATS